MKNFALVEEKMKEVEEKDHLRNFKPPVSGEEIMVTFGVGPGRVIGEIKDAIKDAILEGDIPNDHESAKRLMISIGIEKGLAVNNQND